MNRVNSVFSALGTTIFEVMSRLAVEKGAVNLGQGFPEGLEPAVMIDRLSQVALTGSHQYPSMMGTPSLRQAIAAHEARYWGLNLDPATQVMVTSGATEALAACLLALIEPGQEVIVLEPAYDSYVPIIRRGGGIPVPVRMEPPHWDLPRERLEAAVSNRTRLLILNSPANPIGKVYDQDELAFLADLAQRHGLTVLCDEVYEHLVYDGLRHIPLMTLPGMTERCVKIGSAGKIFSLTGWKVGWVTASPALLAVIAKAHQFLTFTTPPVLQDVVAWGLENAQDYIAGLPALLTARRDRLSRGLAASGFVPQVAQGSYFLTTDYAAFSSERDDAAFCRRLVEDAGVAAIPISAFYGSGEATGCIRFCFAKTDAAVDAALDRIGQWSGSRQ